jgi:hypothetical protein
LGYAWCPPFPKYPWNIIALPGNADRFGRNDGIPNGLLMYRTPAEKKQASVSVAGNADKYSLTQL